MNWSNLWVWPLHFLSKLIDSFNEFISILTNRWSHFSGLVVRLLNVVPEFSYEIGIWLSSASRLLVWNSILMVAGFILFGLIVEPLPYMGRIPELFMLGLVILVPLSRALSILFVSYVMVIQYIQRNGRRFIKNRVAPYNNGQRMSYPGKRINARKVKEKNKYFWFYGHILSITVISIALLVDDGVIVLQSGSHWNVIIRAIKDITNVLPFADILIESVINKLSANEKTYGPIFVALVIPAVIYSIPSMNSLDYGREREYNRYPTDKSKVHRIKYWSKKLLLIGMSFGGFYWFIQLL